MAVYYATKAFVLSFTEALAVGHIRAESCTSPTRAARKRTCGSSTPLSMPRTRFCGSIRLRTASRSPARPTNRSSGCGPGLPVGVSVPTRPAASTTATRTSYRSPGAGCVGPIRRVTDAGRYASDARRTTSRSRDRVGGGPCARGRLLVRDPCPVCIAAGHWFPSFLWTWHSPAGHRRTKRRGFPVRVRRLRRSPFDHRVAD